MTPRICNTLGRMETGAEPGGRLGVERLARYRWAADALAGDRVLDAACGAGAGTELLARTGASVAGVDLSPAAIEAARRDFGEIAEFRVGELERLPFEDGRFDAVVCFEAIAHVPAVAPVLDELRRVLRPAGLLLVSAPNPQAYPPGNPLHLSELSPGELEELLGERFATVAIHRQHSVAASLIGDETLPAGGALHAIAAASNGDLPTPPALLVPAADDDRQEERRQLVVWRERAVKAEAEAEALRRKLDAGQS
jgi:2-polyprenyl-3-methyl-5-hydroxy-6-metoxy-1,4-benzoquinol methylase